MHSHYSYIQKYDHDINLVSLASLGDLITIKVSSSSLSLFQQCTLFLLLSTKGISFNDFLFCSNFHYTFAWQNNIKATSIGVMCLFKDCPGFNKMGSGLKRLTPFFPFPTCRNSFYTATKVPLSSA